MPNTDLTPGGAAGLQGSSYVYDYGTSPNTRTAVSQKVRILAPAYGTTSQLLQMGVLSNFAPTESRSVEPLRGIGFGDQIAELVPSVTEPMTANFERALMYLSNLWQATGYSGGIDGPVRSLRHHRWPFDVEEQVVFSTLADMDMGVENEGFQGQGFQGGTTQITYPDQLDGSTGPTPNGDFPQGGQQGHSAIITLYEACWFTSWSKTVNRDQGMIMETGDVTISDVHDFSSEYGEFLATGNDPSVGQLGSVRFGDPQQGGTQFIP
jgi:hypothetical protein